MRSVLQTAVSIVLTLAIFITSSSILPNGGFDLDSAAPKFVKKAELTEPIFLLTSDPYGDACDGDKPDCFYFCGVESESRFSIISTYLWDGLTGKRLLQDYLLFMLGTAMLCTLTGLHFHSERMGCVLDYCDQHHDIDLAFQSGQLCQACQSAVMRAATGNMISLAQYASSMKLINRACGKRECFVVMPFRDELNSLYEKSVRPVLQENGYNVIRGDRIIWPRIITDAILLKILTSDLVVAELTGHNPNVFYEIGVADAVGADMIFLIQEGASIPFDVNQRRTIQYRPGALKKLSSELKHFCE